MPNDRIETYEHPEDKTEVKKTWSCKALIFEKRGKVIHILLVPNEHDGHWSIPGWSMKEWEDEISTLMRECREELEVSGFEIKESKPFSCTEEIFQSSKDQKWRHKVYMWYLCTYNKSSDLGKWEFVPLTEAVRRVKDFERKILQDIDDAEIE